MDASAHRGSYWVGTSPASNFPRLEGELEVDVAIIGGGIVGVTAARLLKDAGQRVALVEARKVGEQVTGKSTAKVTSQHNLKYHKLEKTFGEERARLYGEANEAGVRLIESLAARYGIDCDLESKPAYTYTLEEKSVSKIEKEVEVTQRLGLPARLVKQADLPFEFKAAICFDNQAQFHPVKYVAGLAATIPGDGSHVFENSRAVDYEPTEVRTEHGRIKARHVVMATHMPLGQVGPFYAEAYPHAHPVIAARIGRVPEGMFITVESPTHSIRTHRRENGDIYAIVTGASYKIGHTDQERKMFADIERWLSEHFEPGPVEYRWVNEDYTPMDGAPFIGWSSSLKQGYLVATGFDAWGISNGTAAAMIIADLATGKDNEWLRIFDATRVKPIAGGPRFVKENLHVAKELVSGHLSSRADSLDAIGSGEAAVLKIDGKEIAAFKDEQGQVHAVSAVCTHMGCVVGWNENDRTWDCPCHGSRFDISGEVIHGPAVKALERKSIEAEA